ncbi:MAG: helix-turn-helix domain-containing protein [Chloroflexota bacterium]
MDAAETRALRIRLGQAVRVYRDSQVMTLAELADKVGVTGGELEAVEAGSIPATLELLTALAEVFDAPLLSLLIEAAAMPMAPAEAARATDALFSDEDLVEVAGYLLEFDRARRRQVRDFCARLAGQ